MTNCNQRFRYLFANQSVHKISMNGLSLKSLIESKKEFHPAYFKNGKVSRRNQKYFTILNFYLSITHPQYHLLQRLAKIPNSGYSLVVYYNNGDAYLTIRLQLLLWDKYLKTLNSRVTKLENSFDEPNEYSFVFISVDDLKSRLHDFLTCDNSMVNQSFLKTDLLFLF